MSQSDSKRRKKRTAEEDFRIAIHEAGHYVAAWFAEHVPADRRVTIKRSRDTEGRVTGPGIGNKNMRSRDALVQRGAVSLSGEIAEAWSLGEKPFGRGEASLGATSDVLMATWIAQHLVAHVYGKDPADEAQQRAAVEEMVREAERILDARWGEVERLARALVERRTILIDEAQLILGCPPAGVRD